MFDFFSPTTTLFLVGIASMVLGIANAFLATDNYLTMSPRRILLRAFRNSAVSAGIAALLLTLLPKALPLHHFLAHIAIILCNGMILMPLVIRDGRRYVRNYQKMCDRVAAFIAANFKDLGQMHSGEMVITELTLSAALRDGGLDDYPRQMISFLRDHIAEVGREKGTEYSFTCNLHGDGEYTLQQGVYHTVTEPDLHAWTAKVQNNSLSWLPQPARRSIVEQGP